MPHVSKRKLDETTYALLGEALTSLFSNLSSAQAKNVLAALLTNTERLMLAKRVGTALMLRERIPDSEIAESLKLTRWTVSRFMLAIKAGPQETWEFILKKLEQWHNLSLLKQTLKEIGKQALKTFTKGMAGKV